MESRSEKSQSLLLESSERILPAATEDNENASTRIPSSKHHMVHTEQVQLLHPRENNFSTRAFIYYL